MLPVLPHTTTHSHTHTHNHTPEPTKGGNTPTARRSISLDVSAIMPGHLSIQEQFRDSTVLLTGATGACRSRSSRLLSQFRSSLFNPLTTISVATGYVGGLVLEALLRTTAVTKVYVLLRAKGGQPPDQRLAKLLQVLLLLLLLLLQWRRKHTRVSFCAAME